jgi:hypothetical protein
VTSTVRTASEPAVESASEPRAELAAPGAAPKSQPSAAPRELVLAQADALPATPPPPDLHGSVVLVEPDGTERTMVTGSLDWTSWAYSTPRHQQVNVVNGAWTVPGELLRGANALSFRSLQLGVQGAAIDAPIGLVRKPFADEIVVRARVLSNASLRVLAADTGLELQHVTLLSTRQFGDEERHPGVGYEPRILAQDLRSPIVLEDPIFPRRRFGKAASAHILVGAPRYAWTNAEIGLEAGGEHVVALEPGADLAIDVIGCAPSQSSILRVRRKDEFHEPFAELALRADGRFVLNGLPAGEYRIAAEVEADGPGDAPVLLGMVVVQLRAGELTEARLELGAAPALQTVGASGVVFLPKSWKASQLRLALMLLDKPREASEAELSLSASAIPSQRNGFDAFAWSQDQLQVGSYLLRSEDPVDATVIDVPAGGRAGLEWVLAPPADLLVHVVDDASGAPLDVSVWWREPEHHGQFTVAGTPTHEGPGVYRVRAPQREIEVRARHRDYEPRAESVDLAQGTRELTLRLQRAMGFTVRLMDGAFPVDCEASTPGFAEAEGGSGKVLGATLSKTEWRFSVSEPGRYRLRMSVISGYKPVPDQLIDVFAGSFTEHVIALERAD